MFVVTVFLEAQPQHVDSLRTALMGEAKTSLLSERCCRQFDVAQDVVDPASFFIYALFDDEAAFEAHRESEHVHQFRDRIRSWVASYRVLTYELLTGQGRP